MRRPLCLAWALLSSILVACTPAATPPPRTAELAALQARVAALEAAAATSAAKPGSNSDSAAPTLADLSQRIDDLETLARETRSLQQDIEQLVTRLAQRAASSTSPLAATQRGDFLDPQRRYRIAIANSPAFGSPAAPVTIVAAIQIPERFTHQLWPTLRALRAKYGDDLRVVVQGFLVNPQALATTSAACAAAHQSAEALDKLEDALWTARELAQTDASKPWPDADDARTAAGAAGVDLKAYDAEITACGKSVDREQRALAAVGQTAAPTLWINGRPIVGAQTADQLALIIDDELAKAKADHAQGGSPKSYYDRLMKTAAVTAR